MADVGRTRNEEPEEDDRGPSRWKSGLIAFGVLLPVAWVMPEWLLWMNGGGGGGTVPLLAFAVLAGLVIVKQLLPKASLTSSDLLAVFVIVAVGISGFGVVTSLIGLLPTPYYYASPENDYAGHFLTELPSFLVPFNPLSDGTIEGPIQEYYRGAKRGQGVPWDAWIGPLTWWSALFGFLYLGQICMAAILRRQWLEHEHLLFPQVTMMAALLEKETEGPLWRRRLFWYGFGASSLMFLLEGLNHYIPGVPDPGLKAMSMRPFLAEEPWRSMRPGLAVQPALVAVSYMLTTEISFSIWFFAVVDNLLRAMASGLTLPRPISDAWVSERLNMGSDAMGAMLVFVIGLFWTSRRHFAEVVRIGFFGNGGDADAEEALRYRPAVLGLGLSIAGTFAWFAHAEMSLLFCALVMGVYAASAIFVARLAAETGMPEASVSWVRPQITAVHLMGFGGGDPALTAAGTAAQSPLVGTLGIFSFIWPNILTGGHLLPTLLTGLRAVDEGGRDRGTRRFVLIAGIVGLAAATFVFAWRMLVGVYESGALNSEASVFRGGTWVFGNTLIRDVILRERSQTTDWTEVAFMFVGGCVMTLLLVLRRKFYWWPLHPIGYIATVVHRGLWFSVLLGWMVKRFLLKYGGGAGFRGGIPFFAGLFAGQYGMAVFWYLVGIWLGEAEVHVFRSVEIG